MRRKGINQRSRLIVSVHGARTGFISQSWWDRYPHSQPVYEVTVSYYKQSRDILLPNLKNGIFTIEGGKDSIANADEYAIHYFVFKDHRDNVLPPESCDYQSIIRNIIKDAFEESELTVKNIMVQCRRKPNRIGDRIAYRTSIVFE